MVTTSNFEKFMAYKISNEKNNIEIEVTAENLQGLFRESFFSIMEVLQGAFIVQKDDKSDELKIENAKIAKKTPGLDIDDQSFEPSKCGGACMKDCFLGCSFNSLEDNICGFDSFVVRRIDVSAADKDSLLFNFLTELLDLTDLNKEVYVNLEFLLFSEEKLVVDIFPLSIEKFTPVIKKIEQSGVEIAKSSKGYKANLKLELY